MRLPPETEHEAQKALVQYAGLHGHRIVAIPNGGKRSVRDGREKKDEGLSPGFPDVFMPYQRRGWHGAFIEAKVQGRKPSPEQKEWIKWLMDNGYYATVCNGSEEMIDFYNWYIRGEKR